MSSDLMEPCPVLLGLQKVCTLFIWDKFEDFTKKVPLRHCLERRVGFWHVAVGIGRNSQHKTWHGGGGKKNGFIPDKGPDPRELTSVQSSPSSYDNLMVSSRTPFILIMQLQDLL